MSRKGTFYCGLISAYSQGCGLMSVLAECVLIQDLDHCQVWAWGSRCRFLRVSWSDCFGVFFIFIEEEFVLWVLIFPFLSVRYNRNLGFLPRDVVSLRCGPPSKHLLFLSSGHLTINRYQFLCPSHLVLKIVKYLFKSNMFRATFALNVNVVRLKWINWCVIDINLIPYWPRLQLMMRLVPGLILGLVQWCHSAVVGFHLGPRPVLVRQVKPRCRHQRLHNHFKCGTPRLGGPSWTRISTLAQRSC